MNITLSDVGLSALEADGPVLVTGGPGSGKTTLALLKAQGQTTLVVDKYVDKLLPLADHNLILERGRIAWQGSSAELDARRELWGRYLGV